jgi:signal transduction histidine kinase
MTDKGKIYSIFYLSFIIFITISYFTFRSIYKYNKTANLVVHSKDIITEANNVLTATLDIETSQRGYLITGKETFLTSRHPAIKHIYNSYSRLKLLVADNAIKKSLCDSLQNLITLKINNSYSIILTYKEEGFKEAQEIIISGQGKMITDKIRLLVEEIIKKEQVWLINQFETNQQNLKNIIMMIIIIVTLSLLFLIVSSIFLLRDYYKRLINEIKLNKYAGELENKNKELEQFAYISSHDLQEPLRNITNYVTLLEKRTKKNIDKETEHVLNVIVKSAERMKILIREILLYSRIGKNREIKKVDCNKVLSEVLEAIDLSIRENQAKIITDHLPVIDSDEIEIRQLFQNLLSNALKFKKNNIAPEIHVHCEGKDKEWWFSVNDNGIGIEIEYMNKMFHIFQRLHTEEEYPGTGIGLATCKKIVELNNGKIWLSSKLGIGSIFYFTIPKQ